jgi:hypothetical protein
MSMLMAVFLALVGVGASMFLKATEVAITNEYASWAPALGRVYVRLAGIICPSHRRDWQANILSIQRDEGRSGLYEATLCLLGAPVLAIRESPRSVRSRLRRRTATSRLVVAQSVYVRNIFEGGVASDAVPQIIRAQHRSIPTTRPRSRIVQPHPGTQ